MKHLAMLSIVLVLLLTQGCTSNDKNGAGTEASILTPASASAAPPSGGAAPVSHSSDPAASGGSSLPASAPYSQPGSASVQQSVNPAPFLTASQSAGTGGTGAAPVEALTSRADGTMSGPNDQPAATTGWGTTVPPATPAAVKRGSSAPK